MELSGVLQRMLHGAWTRGPCFHPSQSGFNPSEIGESLTAETVENIDPSTSPRTVTYWWYDPRQVIGTL